MSYFAVGLLAFALSYIIVAALRRWALRRNLLDIPNERSSHIVPTPRGGGLAIALIVLVGSTLAQAWSNSLVPGSFLGYMLGALVVVAISGMDDVFKISPKVRLLFHLLAAIAFVAGSGFINRIDLPLVGDLNWGWLGIPIALLWFVGLTNAYNFMDGIDGIAAGQAIVAGSFWLVVSLALNVSALTLPTVLLVGASLGFLLHNIPPARIFMGDVGSAFLGFTFAALPVLAYAQATNSRFFVAGILCVVPFVFDTSLTLVRRALNHEDVLQPHRTHLYQRLISLGHHHGSVSLLYVTLAFLSSLAAFAYLWANDLVRMLALLLVACFLVLNAILITRRERRTTILPSTFNTSTLSSSVKKSA